METKDPAAVSLGTRSWAATVAKLTPEQLSKRMRKLARKRKAKLSPKRRREIAAMGGAASKGSKKPGAGRKKAKP